MAKALMIATTEMTNQYIKPYLFDQIHTSYWLHVYKHVNLYKKQHESMLNAKHSLANDSIIVGLLISLEVNEKIQHTKNTGVISDQLLTLSIYLDLLNTSVYLFLLFHSIQYKLKMCNSGQLKMHILIKILTLSIHPDLLDTNICIFAF